MGSKRIPFRIAAHRIFRELSEKEVYARIVCGEILVDGEPTKKVKISAENMFSYDDRLVIEGRKVTSGEHKIEFRKTGTGPLYWNAYLTNFTLEDPITKAGLEIKVERKFYKLVVDLGHVGEIHRLDHDVGIRVLLQAAQDIQATATARPLECVVGVSHQL